MRHLRVRQYVASQAGSSLLVTLVVITVLTILVGAVLMVRVAQYRFIRRDAHRLQARYAAEAGAYVAMDRLQQDPFWRARDAVLPLPEGLHSRVTVEAFGGYLFIRSTAQYRRSRCIVRALVGQVPPELFRKAVVLWDAASGLRIAGRTQIRGDVVVGRRGLRKSTFEGRRFTGWVKGTVRAVPDLAPPYFDERFLQEAVDAAERYLRLSSGEVEPSDSPLPPEVRLPGENGRLVVPGHLVLSPADSLLFREPVTVVAQGDVVLHGPLHFQPGTYLIAGGRLLIGRRVGGRSGLFYGREGVEIADSVRCAGQFFSQRYVRLRRGTYLAHPSVLYVSIDAGGEGGLFVEEGTVVDGTIVHPALDLGSVSLRGRVVVAPSARVRGAIFNAHATELHGTLYGTLLTHQLYFYAPPTGYVNWLKDSVIDETARPASHLLPLGFSPMPRLAVLEWDVHVEGADSISL